MLTSSPEDHSRLDNHLASLVPPDIQVDGVKLVRPEDAIKLRLRRTLRRTNAKQPTSSVTSDRLSGSSGSVVPGSADEARPDTTLQKLRRQATELAFAIPDDRIGWKRNAVTKGMEIVSERRPSLIYATAPPFSSLLVGQAIAREANLPLVLDFRDPWTRVPWGPRNKSWIANRWVARLERSCVYDASVVILNTPELRDDFANYYSKLPCEKFVSITNGFDPEIRPSIQSYLDAQVVASKDDKPLRLLHPGSLYRNRDPRPVVDAVAKLKANGKTIVLEQVGYCDPNFDLLRYAADRGVESQIEIKPAIPHDQMLRRMAEVDAFLLLQPGTSLQVPGKLFEMILFKKPILTLCVPGAVANIVNRYQIGTIAQADDADSIASAMAKLWTNSTTSAMWDSVAADFDGRSLTKQLADVFNTAIATHANACKRCP
ncbi:glycosyltransferase [Stieleria sedimenti]|uniref:glycosyltransferase n=1 Tax=Stieleria sedimenti TaxID=2976331 RepID=UPI002B1E978D|nr:glycosyltransferase [Stieleria sedimenti]